MHCSRALSLSSYIRMWAHGLPLHQSLEVSDWCYGARTNLLKRRVRALARFVRTVRPRFSVFSHRHWVPHHPLMRTAEQIKVPKLTSMYWIKRRWLLLHCNLHRITGTHLLRKIYPKVPQYTLRRLPQLLRQLGALSQPAWFAHGSRRNNVRTAIGPWFGTYHWRCSSECRSIAAYFRTLKEGTGYETVDGGQDGPDRVSVLLHSF